MALKLSKLGPEILTTILSAITSLIQKEPPQSGTDTIIKLAEAGFLKKPEDEDASSQTIRALQTEARDLKDSLQRQEMDTLKNAVVSLPNRIDEMRKEISNQGRLEGRYALMEKTITTIDSQLTGLRSDARSLLDSLARGGGRVSADQEKP